MEVDWRSMQIFGHRPFRSSQHPVLEIENDRIKASANKSHPKNREVHFARETKEKFVYQLLHKREYTLFKMQISAFLAFAKCYIV